MESDEAMHMALERLRKQFPELDEGVLREALVMNGNDYDRADKALRAKYYNEETGIDKESSFWSSLFGGSESGQGTGGHAEDWTIENIGDSIANLGAQLMAGVDNVADTIGSIGDLLPELLFGPEDEEMTQEALEKASKGDKGQVVFGGNRSGMIKKRGEKAPARVPGTAPLKSAEELDDEESNDWTKED